MIMIFGIAVSCGSEVVGSEVVGERDPNEVYRKGHAATGTTRKMAADNELSKWGFTAVCGEEGQGCYHCSGTRY